MAATPRRRAPIVQTDIEPGTGGRFNYVVTTNTGYRAVIERCDRDDCKVPVDRGGIAECRIPLDERHLHKVGNSNKPDPWSKHCRTHCHGWHDGRVADFAAAVLKTYGSYKPFTAVRARASLRGRSPLRPLVDPVELERALLGAMTVDEYRGEVAKAAS